VKTVKSLVTGRVDGYRQSEVGVITPWREQVWRIRLKLREAGYHDINVGNVEVSIKITVGISEAKLMDRNLAGVSRGRVSLCDSVLRSIPLAFHSR
jgi:hypothetical protein